MENSNRIIKFRAWYPKKYFKDGSGVDYEAHMTLPFTFSGASGWDDGSVRFYDENDDNFIDREDIENKDCILMQFTGLYDKNGKEIYESDLIRIKPDYHTNEEIHCVTWDKELAGFRADCHIFFIDGLPEEIEVIGNIYQNNELLK